MPALGADMEAGILTSWLVQPGASVSRGDVIATVETHKGIIDVEIFHDAVIERLLVETGTRVPVGQPIALLRDPPGARPAAALPSASSTPMPAQEAAAEPPEKSPAGRPRISPAARRRAAELGIDPSTLAGSQPDGTIRLADIGQAAHRASPAADPRAQMRGVIAAAMARSKREIPHYYLATTIPMDAALDWLATRNAAVTIEQRIVPTLLFVRATALALGSFPDFSGAYTDGRHAPAPEVHVGVAIALRGGGLVAPALRHTATRSLDELAPAFLDLVNRVRSGRVRSSEVEGAMITVTSLGAQGVETVFPVIYPPQVAIVGFGAVHAQPWADGGMIGSRRVVHASLAADHRVSDGHRGALFLQKISRLLQEPDQL
jgi:pyruvate dehydrogenase E2 component (dihydrolipoamide acetyltransferase)